MFCRVIESYDYVRILNEKSGEANKIYDANKIYV